MNNQKKSIAIIGAGRIVAGYDSPETDGAFTHLHALQLSGGFEITGVFDHDRIGLEAACAKWNVPAADSFQALMDTKPDAVLIAVPDAYHEEYLIKLLDYKPALVICEKPLTLSVDTSGKIVERYRMENIPLAVSYQRRYDTDVNQLKMAMAEGTPGRFISGSVLYSKGILHNGSHAVDLLQYLFGKIENAESYLANVDYSEKDPTMHARLSFNQGDIFMIGGDERFHSLFEIDLVFEKVRYRFLESGHDLEIYKVLPDANYPGYFTLTNTEKRSSTLKYALVNMWQEIALFMENKAPLRCTGNDAFLTQKACMSLIK
jgi:predicted dehydrogenase